MPALSALVDIRLLLYSLILHTCHKAQHRLADLTAGEEDTEEVDTEEEDTEEEDTEEEDTEEEETEEEETEEEDTEEEETEEEDTEEEDTEEEDTEEEDTEEEDTEEEDTEEEETEELILCDFPESPVSLNSSILSSAAYLKPGRVHLFQTRLDPRNSISQWRLGELIDRSKGNQQR
ncbi:hypothetical protein DPEC_G00289930 [Dallia pectoralis]|uniref:Uncharacterized protein n=1 Tax=Dallia pectoralis TaxID=75939 RepID=A0ACC2FH91_DALPE|nr:hypothetical protein DPEC_G00289930 [Dallia pectoralis]